jgi:hypothetical protein
MIAKNNSQGPYASRRRSDFGQLNFRQVRSAGAASGSREIGVSSRPADAVNEISSDRGRSIALWRGDVDELNPRIDPAYWRLSRAPMAGPAHINLDLG